jgi:hypothetical protein
MNIKWDVAKVLQKTKKIATKLKNKMQNKIN